MTSLLEESTTFPFHEMQLNWYLIDMPLYDSPPTRQLHTFNNFLCMKSRVKQLQNQSCYALHSFENDCGIEMKFMQQEDASDVKRVS